jgi:cell division protein FtsI/penicillin-binding protein 2
VTSAWAHTEAAEIRWSTADLHAETPKARNTEGALVPLGIDGELQSELARLLERAKPIAGGATMVDVVTGQILAAAEIGTSPEGSLLFEPIAPAASLFKIVTTIALYEHTSVTPTTRICTEGGQRDILRSHLTPAQGVDAVCGKFGHALGVSRNAAYAQLATQKLLRTDLERTAHSLGFGQPLALDAAGKMGSVEIPYNDLSFARTAAGFENSKLSVFGGAALALTIASGGLKRPMHFQKDVELGGGEEVRVMSPRTARRLRDAMEVTIHSGTARSSFVNEHGKSTVGPVQVAGKTGTLKPNKNAPTSSWFIGFAPSESPRVVVSVLLQNPDRWVRRGHELGRDLLQVYLKKIGVQGIRVE